MPKSPAVDAYIARSAPFARPILAHLRRLMHRACPKIEETIKWGMPHFEYQGPVAMMAAFKQHVSFGFWKRKLMADPARIFPKPGQSSMGGRRIRSFSDLPSDRVLIRYIHAAVRLNKKGIKQKRPASRRPAPRTPSDLAAALQRNAKARATFAAFPPSKRRDYVEWLTEAKQDATRKRRLATAVAWMAEGKARNWKYENC